MRLIWVAGVVQLLARDVVLVVAVGTCGALVEHCGSMGSSVGSMGSSTGSSMGRIDVVVVVDVRVVVVHLHRGGRSGR